jgi:hypothetical protein
MEPRFLGHSTSSLVTISTELSHINFVSVPSLLYIVCLVPMGFALTDFTKVVCVYLHLQEVGVILNKQEIVDNNYF